MNYTQHINYLEEALGGNALENALQSVLQGSEGQREQKKFNPLNNPWIKVEDTQNSEELELEPTPPISAPYEVPSYMRGDPLAINRPASLVDEENPGLYVRTEEALGQLEDEWYKLNKENTDRLLNGEKGQSPEELLLLASENTIYKKKLDGTYQNYDILQELSNRDIPEVEKNRAKKQKDFQNLNELFTSYDDFELEASDDNKMYQKIVEKLKQTGGYGTVYTKEQLENIWNSKSPEERRAYVYTVIGADLYGNTPYKYNEFRNSSLDFKELMLANSYTINPFYNKNNPWEKEKKRTTSLKDEWAAERDYSDRYFAERSKDAKWWQVDKWLGGGAWRVLNTAYGIALNLVGTGIAKAQQELGKGDEYQDLDNKVRGLLKQYIERVGKDYEDLLIRQINDGTLTLEGITKEFDLISRENSEIFKLYEGTSTTEISGDSTPSMEKLKLYALYKTELAANGPRAALLRIIDYYKDLAASNMSTLDYIGHAAGLFAANGAADALSFAAVILAVPMSGLGLWSEGYTDYLMHSSFMEYASNLQETGCFTPEGQRKYKNSGLNQFQIWKTAEGERAFLDWSTLGYDLFGLYGFTAATTLLSMGGSGMVSGLSRLSKGELSKGVRTRGIRALSKVHLLSEEAAAEKIAFLNSKEFLASRVARNYYYGNLGFAGLLGTAEGGLEAISTYKTFVRDNLDPLVGLNGIISDLKERIKNADPADLEKYMLSNQDVFPVRFSNTLRETRSLRARYEEKDYQLAKDMLLKEVETIENDIRDKVEDDALDAASANFLMNSLINGALKVTLESTLLSKDMRAASRAFRGDKPMSSFIDIKKGANGAWEASVKNGKGITWKQALLHPVNTAKNASVGGIYNTVKTGIKTSFGEGLEEYSLGISDNISRAAFQSDLDRYTEIVFDDKMRQAFESDYNDILFTGLSLMGSELTNIENIREGVYGMLSTLIGGVSPGNFIGLTYNNIHNVSKRGDKSVKAYGTALLKSIPSIWEGGLLNAYREGKEDKFAAEHLKDAVNTWLLNKDAQELMTHLGGALGFLRTLLESLMNSDMFEAHNNKLGLAVENITMLESLRGTNFYDAYMRSIDERLSLGENLEVKDDSLGEHYNELGQYMGNDAIIKRFLDTFKNREGNVTRKAPLSDKEIIDKIRNNAVEYKTLRKRVLDAEQRIKNVFKQKNIDPLVWNALSYAIVSSEDTKERKQQLLKQLDNLFELGRQGLTERGYKSQYDTNSLRFLALYGSVQNMRNRLKELDNKKAALKAKKQTKTQEYMSVCREQEYINNALENIEKGSTIQVPVAGDENALPQVITLSDNQILISSDDMFNLDIDTIYKMVLNKDSNFYSEEQKQLIEEFLDKLNRYRSTEDYSSVKEEIALDIIDYKALEIKSKAYDNYLSEYINDPSWLSSKVLTLRAEERKKSLRRLYGNLFILKDNERIPDMIKRVNEKKLELQNDGKEYDAQIIGELLKESKDYRLYTQALKALELAVFAYMLMNKGTQGAEQNARKAFTLLKTIIENGKLSFVDLEKLFVDNNITQIKNYLSGLLSYKDNFIRNLQQLELDTSIINNTDGIINASKDVIMAAKNYLDSKKPKKVVAKERASTPENPPSTKNPPLSNREPVTLTVTTLGDWDSETNIHNFLKQNNADATLEQIFNDGKNKRNLTLRKVMIGNIAFPVLYYDGKPVAAFKMDEINKSKLKEIYEKALPNETIDIKGSDNQPLSFEVNRITTPQAVSQHNQLEWPEIREGIDIRDEKAIKDFVDSIAMGARINTETGELDWYWYTEGKFAELEYPVRIKPSENDSNKFISIFEMTVVDGSTRISLNALLNDNSKSLEEKVKILESNEFFKLLLNAWENYSTNILRQEPAKSIYNKLIGNFIYLGSIYNDVKPKNGDLILETIEENGKTTLLVKVKRLVLYYNTTKEEEIELLDIVLPTANANNSGKEENKKALIDFLKLLQDKKADSNISGFLPYNNPQLVPLKKDGRNGLQEYSKPVAAALIKEGILIGNVPEAYKAILEVQNPLFRRNPRPQTTDNGNVSLFSPQKPGAVTGNGAVVDSHSGIPLQGNPEDVEKRNQEFIEKQLGEAFALVRKVTAKSKDSDDPNETHLEYYEVNGLPYARTTLVEHGLKGAGIKPYDNGKTPKFDSPTGTGTSTTTALEPEDRGNVHTAFGNIIDDIVRESLKWCNANNDKLNNTREAQKKLLEYIKKRFESYVAQSMIQQSDNRKHVTHTAALSIVEKVLTLYDITKSNDWIIIPSGITAFGSFDVVDNNGDKTGSLRVAGTLDILAYDRSNNKFIIIDIKTTMADAISTEAETRYRGQTSLYREECIQSMSEGVTDELKKNEIAAMFGGLYVFPFYLTCSIPSGKVIVGADGRTMSMEGNSNVKPVLMGIKEDATNKKNPLIKLDPFKRNLIIFSQEQLQLKNPATDLLEFPSNIGRAFTSVEEEKNQLGTAELQVGGNVSLEPSVNIPNTNTPQSGPLLAEQVQTAEEAANETDNDEFTDLSERTSLEARLTDFINNRIAPIMTYKLAIISKAFSYIRKIFQKKDISEAIRSDFAMTFFNGDIDKFDSVSGINENMDNISEVVSNLRNYYTAYTSQRDAYRKNIETKHLLIRALYDLLEENISEYEFNYILSTVNLAGTNIAEFIEYSTADNKEEARQRIIERLQKLELFEESTMQKRLEELDNQMDDMLAKLDFINSGNAETMLRQRMKSIEKALLSNQLELSSYNLSDNIEDMINGTRQFFGVIPVLLELSRRSKSRYTRLLAQSLVDSLRKSGKEVIIQVVDKDSSNIEGSYDGKVIHINRNNSLSSMERLERVVLHEVLHAVSEDNKEIKETLNKLLQEVVNQICRDTGKTEEEVRSGTYGLKNVNEFISEFFTNYAFQESIKQIADNNTRYDSIFDTIILSFKKVFRKESSLWDKIESTMYDIISVQNNQSTTKTMSKSKKLVKESTPYDFTSELERAYMKAGNMSKEEYNTLTEMEREFIRLCCS